MIAGSRTVRTGGVKNQADLRLWETGWAQTQVGRSEVSRVEIGGHRSQPFRAHNSTNFQVGKQVLGGDQAFIASRIIISRFGVRSLDLR
jgi:hypothetical protein